MRKPMINVTIWIMMMWMTAPILSAEDKKPHADGEQASEQVQVEEKRKMNSPKEVGVSKDKSMKVERRRRARSERRAKKREEEVGIVKLMKEEMRAQRKEKESRMTNSLVPTRTPKVSKVFEDSNSSGKIRDTKPSFKKVTK